MPLWSYEERKYCLNIPCGVTSLLFVQGFERLAFHGVRAMLTIYMFENLGYSSGWIVFLYHLFNILGFISAALALLTDRSHWGKFTTFILVSIPYTTGYTLMALSSSYENNPLTPILFIAAIPLIAVGGGFVHSTITLLLIEQYDSKNEEDKMKRGMLLCNYLSIVWLFMARIVFIELQSSVSCFGTDCYLAAFIMVLICIGIAIILFIVMGFSIVELRRSTEGRDCTVFWSGACKNCWRLPKSRDRYLRENREDYTKEELDNIVGFWGSASLFVQLTIFWSYCCQQGSTWTLQATELNPFFMRYLDISPAQMQMLFPLFFLFLVPLQQAACFPLLRKMKIYKIHNRLFAGGIFSVISAVGAWALQEHIGQTKEAIFAGSENSQNKEQLVGKELSSLQLLSIFWQMPQYFCLASAAVLFLSTVFEIPYVMLTGSSMHIGLIICFFSLSCGEALTGILYCTLPVDKKTWFLGNAICQSVACVFFRTIAFFYRSDKIKEDID